MKKITFLLCIAALVFFNENIFGTSASADKAVSFEKHLSNLKIAESYSSAMEARARLLQSIDQEKKDGNIKRARLMRKVLLASSSQEFAGALEWAHRKKEFGKGAVVVVAEPRHTHNHAKVVQNIVSLIAPQAHSYITYIISTQPAAVKNSIINASYGCKEEEYYEHAYMAPQSLYKLIAPQGRQSANNLLVVAAGNSGRPLESTCAGRGICELLEMTVLHKRGLSIGTFPVIIAGSLTNRSTISAFSNSPDSLPLLQDRFLGTLGEGVFVVKEGGGALAEVQGTSFAAPTICGSAALVVGAHPTFSMEEVANTLLESAEKNFFIPSTDPSRKGVFIYDASDPEILALMKSRYPSPKAEVRPFDRAQYGRGILSIRRAFLYADLYEQVKKEKFEESLGKPPVSVDDILKVTNTLFNKKIKHLDHMHAKKIQVAFREWKSRKEKREDRESITPLKNPLSSSDLPLHYEEELPDDDMWA